MIKTVFFDSSAWIELFEATEKGSKIKDLKNTEIISSPINLYEIHRKYSKISDALAIERVDDIIENTAMILVDGGIAVRAAQLRKKYTFSMADAIILATAEQEKAELITTDSDFKVVDEVKVTFI